MTRQNLIKWLHETALMVQESARTRSQQPVILWLPLSNADAESGMEVIAEFLYYFAHTSARLECFIPRGDQFERYFIDSNGKRSISSFVSDRPSLKRIYRDYGALLLPRETHFRGRMLILPHLEYTDHWLNLTLPCLLGRLCPGQAEDDQNALAALRANARDWQNARVAVVGSGPSSEKFLHLRDQIRPDHVIVMNTVIDSDAFVTVPEGVKLWVCALDPALFGRSAFGQEYCVRLGSVLSRSGGTLVTAEHMARHIKLNLPADVSSHYISIRCVQASSTFASCNVDLLRQPLVIDTGNVLSTLALPLASTLGKHVFIFGCDGFSGNAGQTVMVHNARFDSASLKAYALTRTIKGVVSETPYAQCADRLEQSTAAIVDAFRSRGNTITLGSPSANRGFSGLPCLTKP